MKFTYIAPALAALFIGTLAAPTTEASLLKREETALSDVQALFTEVKQHTGAINSTAASINTDSTPAQKADAENSYATNINAITQAITNTRAQVAALPASQREQSPELTSLTQSMLSEIGSIGNTVQASDATSGPAEALVDTVLGLVGSLLDLGPVSALLINLLDGPLAPLLPFI